MNTLDGISARRRLTLLCHLCKRGKSPGTQVQHALAIGTKNTKFRHFLASDCGTIWADTKSARTFAPLTPKTTKPKPATQRFRTKPAIVGGGFYSSPSPLSTRIRPTCESSLAEQKSLKNKDYNPMQRNFRQNIGAMRRRHGRLVDDIQRRQHRHTEA